MATAEELKIRLTAQNDASKVVNKLNSDVANLAKQAKQSSVVLATANGKITSSFSSLGRNAGMAGMQLQQFVGQVSGGVNPMIALSQQGADLGFVLGVPLLGAVVGIGASIASVLIPSLNEAEVKFSDLKNSLSGMTDDFKNMDEQLRATSIAVLVGELTEQTVAYNKAVEARQRAEEKAAKQQEILRKGLAGTGDVSAVAAYQSAKKATEDYNAELAKLQGKEASLNLQRQQTQETLDRVVGVTANLNDEQQKQLDNYNELKSSLVDQINTFGMTSTQVQRYNILISDYDEKQRAALLNLLDHIEAQKQQAEAFKQQNNGIKNLTDGFDAYAESIESVGIESGKAAQRGMKKLEDSLVDLSMGSKSFKDAFKDMARSIIADIIRIQVRQSLLSNMGLISGGSSLFGSLATLSGSTYNTGFMSEQSRMLAAQEFSGGGYTGNGARSGGVDGKGGFPAILHPQETVVDHYQGQSSGVVVNQTINVSTGVQQTVRTEIMGMMPQIASAAKGAVLDARRRGGSFAGAF